MIDEATNRRWLRERLAAMVWINLAIVPPPLSRFHILIEDKIPFAVIVTESTSAAKECSISETADIIDNARQNGLTCIPLNLTHRPQGQQLLRSDLALLIYTRHPKDDLMNIPRGASPLRPFVSEALMRLDHKVALYANTKRTGRLTSEGTWHNSFRSASLNPEKLCAYLSRLIYRYVLIEVGYVTGGNFSRMAWDRSGMLPGMYYGQGMLDFVYPHQEFQFSDFDCI